jgi:hypothetical protein
MEFNPIFLFELLLFNGAVLVWAGYEYWSVRTKKPDPESTTLSDPGHPEG